jgi:hypothetical protein
MFPNNQFLWPGMGTRHGPTVPPSTVVVVAFTQRLPHCPVTG